MTISLAPPPLSIPQAFAQNREQASFFNALLNTLYQVWTSLYAIRFSSTVSTNNATQTTLMRIQVPTNTTMMLEVFVTARRTGGSAGSAGDSAFYRLLGAYKNISGALTGIGTPTIAGGEDQAAWSLDFSDSGEFVLILVTGAANNNITWAGTVYTYSVGG